MSTFAVEEEVEFCGVAWIGQHVGNYIFVHPVGEDLHTKQELNLIYNYSIFTTTSGVSFQLAFVSLLPSFHYLLLRDLVGGSPW